MRIQHRALPDDQLHEVKGAVNATQGELLKAVGDGTTAFGKLLLTDINPSLAGAAQGTPLIIGADQTIVAGAVPYFKAKQTGINVYPVLNSGHFGTDTFNFSPTQAGYYSVSITQLDNPEFPRLFNIDTMTDLSEGSQSCLVHFTANTRYRLDGTGAISLFRVAA